MPFNINFPKFIDFDISTSKMINLEKCSVKNLMSNFHEYKIKKIYTQLAVQYK